LHNHSIIKSLLLGESFLNLRPPWSYGASATRMSQLGDGDGVQTQRRRAVVSPRGVYLERRHESITGRRGSSNPWESSRHTEFRESFSPACAATTLPLEFSPTSCDPPFQSLYLYNMSVSLMQNQPTAVAQSDEIRRYDTGLGLSLDTEQGDDRHSRASSSVSSSSSSWMMEH
jgi:hypothetical protein